MDDANTITLCVSLAGWGVTLIVTAISLRHSKTEVTRTLDQAERLATEQRLAERRAQARERIAAAAAGVGVVVARYVDCLRTRQAPSPDLVIERMEAESRIRIVAPLPVRDAASTLLAEVSRLVADVAARHQGHEPMPGVPDLYVPPDMSAMEQAELAFVDAVRDSLDADLGAA